MLTIKHYFRAFFATYCFVPITLAQIPKPPDTPKRPVTDEYHGVKVVDNYRWLENWDAPETKQWSAAQSSLARQYLDALPARTAIKERFKQLIRASSPAYYDLQFRGGTLFAQKRDPAHQHPTLVAFHSADDPAGAKVIFDPNTSGQGSIAMDFYVASLDGKYIAAAMSANGSGDASARVFRVDTGEELKDTVPRVNFATAGGSIAWKADNSGFFYTRYPQGDERPPEDANFYQQVYFHQLGGNPKEDTYIIGKEFPRIAEIKLSSSDDGRWLIAAVSNGDGGEFAHYVMNSAGHWTQVTHFEDGIVSAAVAGRMASCTCSRARMRREAGLFGCLARMRLLHRRRPWFSKAQAPGQTRALVPRSKASWRAETTCTRSTSSAAHRGCGSSTIVGLLQR